MNEKEFLKWKIISEKTKEERENFKIFAINFYERYHKKKLMWNWHLDLICKKYFKLVAEQKKTPTAERVNRLIIFNVPPRSGKTEFILKLIPLWLAGLEEKIKFISTSYSTSMVQSTAREARNYWVSEEFKATFPWRSELDMTKKAGAWGTQKGFQYYATGSGGSITGFGADIFNIDDPSKPDEIARTGNELAKINAWFGNTVFSRLNPDGLKIIVVIMQRLDDNDLCGYLLSEFKKEFDSGEYIHINIPAIATEDDIYRKKGESFFPKFFSIKDLFQKREAMNRSKGKHYFSAQYQQEPIDIENAEFKKEWFQYFKNSSEREYIEGYIGVDIALSEKATSDWRSIVVVGKGIDGKLYVLHNYYSRDNSNEVMEELFRIQKRFNFPVIIEANGAQKYFANACKKHMETKKQYFYMKEITARGDKNSRMRATLLPLYQNFLIYHEESLRDDELEKEIIRFPKSKHDDNMDGLETAISGFSNFGVEEMKKEEKPEVKIYSNEDLKKEILKEMKNKDRININEEIDEEIDEWDELLYS